MAIIVTNGWDVRIEVAINQWGNDGDTSFFGINVNSSEEWNRTDNRGFIMMVDFGDMKKPYYVSYDSKVTVQGKDDVSDQRGKIAPIPQSF